MEVSIEDLPPEVLAHVFSIKQDGEPVLGPQDWARGEAVCRRWRSLLAGSCTIQHLHLDNSFSSEMCEWLIKRQARISSLTIILLYAPLLHKALPSLQQQVPALLTACGGHCEALHYDVDQILSLPSVLPQPQVHTPHLRDLVSSNFAPWDAGWVASLSQLSGLQHLELCINSEAEGEVAVLPSMGALTSLRVELSGGCPEFRLRLQPALQHLTLLSSDSPVNFRAGPAALPVLQKLRMSVDYGNAAVDFGGMARLRAVTVFVSGELETAGTIAAATALKTLSLRFGGSDDEEDILGCYLERPWVLELLRCLPQSLRGLDLTGRWSHGVAEALAQATQMKALGLSVVSHGLVDPLAPNPPAGAPLWRSVQALSWFHGGNGDYGQLPEGLQSADNVQLLQLCKPVLGSDEEDTLLSLPALQCLYMPFCSKDMARSKEEEATVSELQQRVHSSQTVSADYLGGQHFSFLEAALAELQL